MVHVTMVVDDLGGRAMGDGWSLGDYATMADAVRAVQESCIPGVRGTGCYGMHMDDGRRYSLCGMSGLVERYSDDGDLIERQHPADVR